MKKFIIIIHLAVLFGLVGCGNNLKENIDNKPADESIDVNNKIDSKEQAASNNQNKSDGDNQVNSSTKNNNQNQESQKEKYKAKLDKMNLDFEKSSNAAITTNDMYQEACKEQKQWDDILNEIYGILKVQLSDSDMKKLQSEEIQWIKDRDEKAKKDAAEMAGGTMEKVLYMWSLANSTKERCYVLVDKYMK